MSNETLDEPGVLAKFGVRADQVLDFLTLTGDAVDNVPGVPKVGPKTAAKWLTQYGSLDKVVAHAPEIPGVVGENLRAALDWLPLGRRLLTVKTDCPLPVKASELGIATARRRQLRTLYERFEFKTWLRDIAGADAGAQDAAAGPDAGSTLAGMAARADTRTFAARDTPAADAPRGGAPALRNRARRGGVRALARRDRERGARLLRHRDDEPRSDGGADRRPVVRGRAGPRLLHPARAPLSRCARPAARRTSCCASSRRGSPIPRRRKLGQNVKYDEHVLANHGLALAGVAHDTLLQSYVLESHKPHDMDNLAWRHLNVKTIAYADVTGKGAAQIGFDQVSIEDATAYSAEDADITLQLHRALYPRVAADARARLRLHGDRAAGARRAVHDGAQRRAARRGAARRAKPRARRARDGARAAGVCAGRAAVQSRVAEAARRDPVRRR